MSNTNASLLITELKKQPESFFDEGRAYDLLQEYFEKFPINILEELLTHKNLSVRKSAIWIVSELAGDATPVAEHVLALLNDNDRYVKYYALESVMAFSSSGLKGVFHHVISAFRDHDVVIRKLVMYLVSNATNVQLEEAVQYFSNVDNKTHVEGLRLLLDGANDIQLRRADNLLYGENNVLAVYGAIFLKRYIQTSGRKVSFSLKQIDDEAIKIFLQL